MDGYDFFSETEESRGMKRKLSLNQSSDHDKISSLHVPYQNGSLILMNHPASLTLYKYLSVTVLSGTVSIHGYELSHKTKPSTINVFSSEKTGLIAVTTESPENIWKKKSRSERLSEIFETLFNSQNIATKILQEIGSRIVVIYIKQCAFPPNIEFAEFYRPQAFEYSLCKKEKYKDHYYFRQSKVPPLQFDEEKEKLASEIALLIRSSTIVAANFPKILVIGPRNSGKSTLLRYLINKMISQIRCFYLDTDPGQPEFTPPGVVSLTEVKEAIMGPSFFQQDRKSKMMLFTGDASPSSFDMYSESISKLMELYTTNYSDYPLFVNTMGWIEGAGLKFLKNIFASVEPTVLIEIVPQGKSSFFDYRDYFKGQYFQISCEHHQEANTILAPKILRELSLLSHLGMCQPPFLEVLPINEIRPYYVSWDDISLFVFPGKTILPSRIVEALNGSIVALCHVSETDVLESKNFRFPKILKCDPENECFAYGLVQAVDEKSKLLYVISPLKKHEWTKVNAIIKGNIMIPDALILKQEIYDVPLPHTDVNLQSTEEEDALNESLLYLNTESHESEQNTPDMKLLPPFENYRKPISKRYGQKFVKKPMKK